MDPKAIEMNNLRVLNDYLNQTIDTLSQRPRFAQGFTGTAGFSPFGALPATAGTDTVYGSWLGSSMFPQAATFGGLPGMFSGYPTYGTIDPFYAQRTFGTTALAGWQPGWTAAHEATRQAQVNQALVAKQAVLEAMCRCCGIPV